MKTLIKMLSDALSLFLAVLGALSLSRDKRLIVGGAYVVIIVLWFVAHREEKR